jgi:dTMP kinase
MTYKGKLIVLEGLDGAGKTEQVRRVTDVLLAMALPVVTVREPGGTDAAEAVRELIMGRADLASMTELLLFQAARAQVLHDLVLPCLRAGTHVVMDRYVPSTLAYQGFANGHDLDTVRDLNLIATDGLIADLAFLLDGPVETLMARTGEGRDRLDRRGVEYFTKVREGYHTAVETSYFARRWVVIDARVCGDILGPLAVMLMEAGHGG